MKALYNAYFKIIHRVPDYAHGTRKISKKKIKELMLEKEYDEDYVEAISDEFCQGFGVAKEIILGMIKEDLEKEGYYK